MPKTFRTLLAVAIASVVALAACQPAQQSVPDSTLTAPAATPAAPAFDLSGVRTPVVRLQASDLDASVPACSDFNAYVNGAWLAANPVPGDRTTWGSFESLAERSLEVQRVLAEEAAAGAGSDAIARLVGDFYASGMDEAAIEQAGLAPLQPSLARIDAISDGAGVAAYLRESAAQGRLALFSFYGNADYRDSTQVIAYAGQGGLSLPERAYYLEDREDYVKAREALRAHVAALFTLAGDEAGVAAERADAVVRLETRLARASTPRVELRDPAKRYVPTSLADADALTPNFPWTAFFDAIGVARPAMFSLAMPDFFREVNAMLGDVPAAEWRSYLRYHEIDAAAPFLSAAFAQEDFSFYSQALRGQAEQAPRWKRVLDATNASVGEALGQLYVEAVFPAESKTKMVEMVSHLGLALKARIEALEWMGEETKQRALEKWASFTPKIGYPDRWRDWSQLAVTRGDFAGNALAARAFNARYMFDKIGKPVDKAQWFMTPQTVNAYYNASQNEIVFPAGILQPPFFDPKADDALNYGGIMAVIGHEMIHGYDDQGSKFDAQGNFNNWWTDADRAGFEARTKKLVAQFDGYESIDGIHVNGTLTLGENIADLGGLSAAFDAMKAAQGADFSDPMIEDLSQEQRFFMNWATAWRRNFTPDELKVRLNTDSHAPAPFRAVGAPSNMDSFARAFDCKTGDAMVRPDGVKVVIW
jgi:putative endopeptidase